MTFFEDQNIMNDSKIGITNLLSNITTRPGSHKGGWARLLKCQLHTMGFGSVKILDNKDSLLNYDVIIFDLGAEYSGAINMFGGLDEKAYKRLNEIDQFQGKLFSWKNAPPNLSEGLKSRYTNASTCEGFKQESPEFLERVSARVAGTKVFDHAYRTDSLIVGDSHTPSVWTPTFMIERRDGRTLDGMVKNKTVQRYVEKFRDSGVPIKHVHIHCGSIDVRHHWCRSGEPEQSAASALITLVSQIHEIVPELDQVTLNHTMGIEDESRDLPKTGFYKGTAFFGDWEKRNLVRRIFNEVVDDYTKGCPGWSRVEFPEYFFDESGKLRFEVMELPQSVHISPEHYRWDLDKNEPRWTESHCVNMKVHFGSKSIATRVEKDMYGA